MNTFSLSAYSIPPLVSALLFAVMGFFVWGKNKIAPVNIIFGTLCFLTVWWQLSWTVLFNTSDPALAEFLVRFGYSGIIFVPILLYHFFVVFFKIPHLLDYHLLKFGYIANIVFEIFLVNTNYFVEGFYEYPWGFYPKTGLVHLIYFLTVAAYTLRMLYLVFINKKWMADDSVSKNRLISMRWAIILYTFASYDFLANYGIGVYPISVVFISASLVIIGYLIVRHHAFNIRSIAAEFLAILLLVFILVRFFISGITKESLISDGIIFFGAFVISIFLMRSIGNEVKQQEQLEDLNEHLQEKVDEQTREIKRAYEVEKKARIELQELDKARTTFVLTTQHELRTPLTVMKGYVQKLLSEPPQEFAPETKKYLTEVGDSTEKLSSLVHDLLKVTELKVGETKKETP